MKNILKRAKYKSKRRHIQTGGMLERHPIDCLAGRLGVPELLWLTMTLRSDSTLLQSKSFKKEMNWQGVSHLLTNSCSAREKTPSLVDGNRP
jgi:hypothetical protein